MEVDPQQPGPAEGWTWVETPAKPAPTAQTVWEQMRRSDPATGIKFNPAGEAMREKFNAPLVSTGSDFVDSLTSPANLSLAALGFAKPAAKAAISALSSVMKTLPAEIAPDVVGLLSPRAAHALRVLQKIGGATEAAPKTIAQASAPATVSSAPSASPAAVTPVAPAPPAGQAAAPNLSAPSAGPAPSLPKIQLAGDETKEFLRLVNRGMPGPQAMEAVLQARQLKAMLGTPSPTYADTTFPKGMRGKTP